MATIKAKDIKKMENSEMSNKMKELKLELIKARVASGKTGSSKIKQTKKIIAKIFTLNKSYQDELKDKKNVGNLVSAKRSVKNK